MAWTASINSHVLKGGETSPSKCLIGASLLSANPAEFGIELQRVEAAGADWIHLDVMDGHFVPALTWGAGVIQALRPLSPLCFDVHLMIQNPDFHTYAKAGAHRLTFHPEAVPHVPEALARIKDLGCAASLAISPDENPRSWPESWLDASDGILVMSVVPGKAGQKFMSSAVETVMYLRQNFPHLCLSVDGGITEHTAPLVTANLAQRKDGDFLPAKDRSAPPHAHVRSPVNKKGENGPERDLDALPLSDEVPLLQGADVLIAGSFIFQNPIYTYEEAIAALKNATQHRMPSGYPLGEYIFSQPTP